MPLRGYSDHQEGARTVHLGPQSEAPPSTSFPVWGHGSTATQPPAPQQRCRHSRHQQRLAQPEHSAWHQLGGAVAVAISMQAPHRQRSVALQQACYRRRRHEHRHWACRHRWWACDCVVARVAVGKPEPPPLSSPQASDPRPLLHPPPALRPTPAHAPSAVETGKTRRRSPRCSVRHRTAAPRQPAVHPSASHARIHRLPSCHAMLACSNRQPPHAQYPVSGHDG